MARYFLHVRNGTDEMLDEQGQEFSSVGALQGHVLFAARDLMMGDIRDGVLDLRCRIEAENEAGQVVYSFPFEQGVNIIQEEK